MQVVTRFAPTISGELHIGGLYNALLNYLYAKRNGGLFKLRLDGMDLNPPHDVWQQSIQKDLELFGLHPDQVIKASDRIEVYKGIAGELSKHPRSYYCDCTVQDMLKRARDGSAFYHLYRPEKYPPYCKISGIAVRGPDGDANVAVDCKVTATHEATGHPAVHLTARGGSGNYYWEPMDVGSINHPIIPEITVDLGVEKDISCVDIKWKDRPVLEYEILVLKESKWSTVVFVKKCGRYFVDYKQGQPFPPFTSDRNNFATIKTQFVKVRILECPVPVDKPYFYDYHCRGLGKTLDLNHQDAVLRLRADESISCYDAAYWYNRLPNLVLTSPLDDAVLGVTHCIRGSDIEPWLALELQVARALDTPIRKQLIHGLVIDKRGYKYSKWIESTPVREYLNSGITPDKVLTYLAKKAGLIETKDVLTLSDLIEQFDGTISNNNVVIDETVLLEELRG